MKVINITVDELPENCNSCRFYEREHYKDDDFKVQTYNMCLISEERFDINFYYEKYFLQEKHVNCPLKKQTNEVKNGD